jgi:hypothetical protein
MFGAAAMSPITAAGANGQRWQESVVTVGFITVGFSFVAASILVLCGLRRTTIS